MAAFIISNSDTRTSGLIFSMDNLYNPSEPSFTNCCSFAIIAGLKSKAEFALELSGLKSFVFKRENRIYK